MKQITKRNSYRVIALFALLLLSQWSSAAENTEQKLFARVNGDQLLVERYVQSLRNAAKRRFYHGEAPEDQLRQFKWEVGQELINRQLLLQEAGQRGLNADVSWVEQELLRLITRYSSNPKWEKQKQSIVTDLRRRLNEKSQLDQLEKGVKAVGSPSPKQLESFYKGNPDKFTSPERIRVSMILLKVAPWLPSEAWQERMEEGEVLVMQIKEGSDFRQLAREHSEEKSAERGGDLGYQHRGMLGETAEKVIDELKPGQISDAVQVLEGIAIFRLDQRMPAALNPLDKVRNRAIELWQREAKELAMSKLLKRLRQGAEIELLDPIYQKLDAETRSLNADASTVPANGASG